MLPLYDHQAQRRWRHLDTCQYDSILHPAPPQTNCEVHGVPVVRLPWAEPHSRFTALFERLAIEWLRAASQKAVAERLELSWEETHGIMKRAVKRGLERWKAEVVSKIGVDGKAFRRGHRYLTLVNDLEGSRVRYVAEDRKQTSLDGFWRTLTAATMEPADQRQLLELHQSGLKTGLGEGIKKDGVLQSSIREAGTEAFPLAVQLGGEESFENR